MRTNITKVGPLEIEMELWTTQWIEREALELNSFQNYFSGKQVKNKTVIKMHCCDAKGRVNLASKFLIMEDMSGTITLVYQEKTSTSKAAVMLLSKKISKAHTRVLEAIVAKAAEMDSQSSSWADAQVSDQSEEAKTPTKSVQEMAVMLYATKFDELEEEHKRNVVQIVSCGEAGEDNEEWAFKPTLSTNTSQILRSNAFDL